MTDPAAKLYAWPSSPYSAKVRAFLDAHKVRYAVHAPNAITWKTRIQKVLGYRMIPVLRWHGDYLQDSAEIIDRVAADIGVDTHPPGPNQRIAAELLQLNADEWLIMAAMTYRWQSGPQNIAWITRDFGRCMAPGFPSPVQRYAGGKIANAMQAHLRRMGLQVTDGGDMPAAIRAWTEDTVLASLEALLTRQPYLFGGRASIADFALYGPLQAHLWRDPIPRPVIEQHPNVLAWIKRLMNGCVRLGDWLKDDEVPSELGPIFAAQARDQFPALRAIDAKLSQWRRANPDACAPPTHINGHAFSVGDPAMNTFAAGSRLGRVFPLWRLARIHAAIAALDDDNSRGAKRPFDLPGVNLDSIPAVTPSLERIGYALRFKH